MIEAFTDDEVDFIKTAVNNLESATDYMSDEDIEYLLEKIDSLKERN